MRFENGTKLKLSKSLVPQKDQLAGPDDGKISAELEGEIEHLVEIKSTG